MTRRWSLLYLVGLVVLVLSAAACGGPEPPETPAEMPQTEVAPPPPQDVTPPARPTTVDPEPDPLDGAIQDANRVAYERGLLGEIYFEFDKAELDATSRDRLAKNAQFFNERREFTFTIEGHCDERGTNEYNIALGERRANAAMAYLQTLGVASSRMRVISYGEERPACTESRESCWQRNRRAYFLLSGRN